MKPEDFRIPPNALNNIKNVVAVVSGKGGVGKSLMTSLLAVTMRRKGYNVGIFDADITGASIPKMFGLKSQIEGTKEGMLPALTHNDIKVMSINLLLDESDTAVIWRAPILTGTIKQFWTDVIWGDLDFLFLDMPPGTGDIPLTVFQSLPLSGIVIVTSPQDVVSLIVKKSINMAKTMNVPILGIIENMSYVECPGCRTKIDLYGESKAEKTANELGIKFLGSMPIDPEITKLCDAGKIELFAKDYVNVCVNSLESELIK